MKTKIFKSGNSYAVRIPSEFNPSEGEIAIEAIGDRWILSPTKANSWPPGFFESIRIEDPEFARPEQGEHRSVDL